MEVVPIVVIYAVRSAKTKHNRVEVAQVLLALPNVPQNVKDIQNQVVVVLVLHVLPNVLLSVKDIQNQVVAVQAVLETVRENVIGRVVESVTLYVMTNAVHSAPMLVKQHVLVACQSVKVDVRILVIIIVITKQRHKLLYF